MGSSETLTREEESHVTLLLSLCLSLSLLKWEEPEPVDVVLGDLEASLDGKDRPHVHRLVLVPDCLRVGYAAGKGSISENILF